MAASVRIEDEAFADERYEDLAHYANLADADHARGKMARIWRQCTIEQSHEIETLVALRILGPNAIEALEKSKLGERISDTKVRIKGTAGRVEWLKRLRDNGKHGTKGGRPKKIEPAKPETLQGLPDQTLQGVDHITPPAPAPAKDQRECQGDTALALRLVLRILKNNPRHKIGRLPTADKDKLLNKWAVHVRLMRECDGHSESEIGAMVDWCQSDSFWRANILSTSKLREQWDTLVAHRSRDGSQAPKVVRQSSAEDDEPPPQLFPIKLRAQ